MRRVSPRVRRRRVEVVAQVGDAGELMPRSTAHSPDVAWSTSACRRRTPTRACARRSRSAGAPGVGVARAVAVRRAGATRWSCWPRAPRRGLPAQGPHRRDRRVRPPSGASRRAARRSTLDRVAARRPRRRATTARGAVRARARGAVADGRGPLQRCHRRAARRDAAARIEKPSRTSREARPGAAVEDHPPRPRRADVPPRIDSLAAGAAVTESASGHRCASCSASATRSCSPAMAGSRTRPSWSARSRAPAGSACSASAG